jgi:hypothetical protein
VIRLFSLLFSVVCLAVFVWFGVTVDLGERTFFGHLRAIATSQESQALWEGTKEKLRDFIGIDAAKHAEAAKNAAKDATRSFVEKGGARTFLEPSGPPQEKLTARDQQQMNEQMQKLSGEAKKRANATAQATAKVTAKTPLANRAPGPGVQGRSAPRETDKSRSQQPKPN